MTDQHLLVALEPNEEGQHVWQVAGRAAKRMNATPHVLNVVEPAVSVYADLDFAPLTEYAADWQQDQIRANREYFKKILSGCARAQVNVVEGSPAYEITNAALQADADLIVMGIHNRRGLKRLLGSTTHAVLNTSQRDVLAVHPDGGSEPYKQVVIAIDTTDLADKVFAKAKALLDGSESVNIVSAIIPLTKVFAVPETSVASSASMAQLADEVRSEVKNKVTEAAKRHGFEEALIDIRTGDPRDEIIDAAQVNNADLIIIGSNPRGPLNRLLLGSTARSVLNHTPCDVLVCR